MKIIRPRVIIKTSELDGEKLKKIEEAARTCYKTEDKTGSNDSFLRNVVKRGHESILEHEKITVKIVCDRGISHEIVRHRIGAYSQESTRYCNYSNEKFGNEITVVEPYFFAEDDYKLKMWETCCIQAGALYFDLLNHGATPEEARCVLPTSLKTEIVVSYDFREWRHFLKLRADKHAHPQMRQIAIPILKVFQDVYPEVFSGIGYDTDFPERHYAKVVYVDE